MTLWITLMLACTPEPAALTPESAAELANRIAASPSTAATVLQEGGTDAKTFEAYMYTVAEDAELTRRYLAARK
jgi:hypothetical protein